MSTLGTPLSDAESLPELQPARMSAVTEATAIVKPDASYASVPPSLLNIFSG